MARQLAIQTEVAPAEGYVLAFLNEAGLLDPHKTRIHLESIDVVRKIASKSELSDSRFFERLECAIFDDFQCNDRNTISRAMALMLDCATYYDNTGRSDKALSLSLQALARAKQSGNVNLSRRSHSFVGAVYSRLCDFSNACMHMQQAYRLAEELGDSLAIFATLANTVAVLEAMGLLSAAKELALKLSYRQPWGNEKLDYLHLSNASNGLRMCNLLNDQTTALIFYEIATKAIKTSAAFTSEITKAHFESARVTYLVSIGKVKEAEDLVSKALNSESARNNIKVRALLVCAQANVHLEICSPQKLRISCDEAICLLDVTRKLPDHHEELLRTLVKLYTALDQQRSDESLKEAIIYLRLLRTYILSIKHQQFFVGASNHLMSMPRKRLPLENPSYTLPPWISAIDSDEASRVCRGELNSNIDRKSVPYDVDELRTKSSETKFRTSEFNVAENWAVAAEFASGGNGKHCFNVGLIAAAIAQKSAIPKLNVVRLELACRLHDIGKIAVAFSQLAATECRTLGTFSFACEHTICGETLLSASSDKTLQLATVISRAHHEWWNGCGYPSGLSRAEIPLEGRICSIADAFVSMVCPPESETRWTVSSALHQIQSMSGMQFDPSLVLPLVQVVAEMKVTKDGYFDFNRTRLDKNQLARAKKELYCVLDLIG